MLQQTARDTARAAPALGAVLSRSAAGLLGGYAFVWGFVTLGIAALVAWGVPYEEAHTAVMLLAFLVFLVSFLWAFAAANVVRLWAILVGGGAVMTAAAWWLSRAAG